MGRSCRQAPIGSRPIRSASYRMIRRWAMTDRSKRGHEVSQLEGQAITHRHPPVSPSDTDRRENDAHSQLEGEPGTVTVFRATEDTGFRPRSSVTAVWLYHRFSLSFRDVEDLLAERGITVTYETISPRFHAPTRVPGEARSRGTR